MPTQLELHPRPLPDLLGRLDEGYVNVRHEQVQQTGQVVFGRRLDVRQLGQQCVVQELQPIPRVAARHVVLRGRQRAASGRAAAHHAGPPHGQDRRARVRDHELVLRLLPDDDVLDEQSNAVLGGRGDGAHAQHGGEREHAGDQHADQNRNHLHAQAVLHARIHGKLDALGTLAGARGAQGLHQVRPAPHDPKAFPGHRQPNEEHQHWQHGTVVPDVRAQADRYQDQ
mmetsp:Transcript_49931/g.151955  ORF Transcript_49931/g.151955 Transcript_49931/m.151955 type:complete len:227 (-) Transcript_49931:29-709(-)